MGVRALRDSHHRDRGPRRDPMGERPGQAAVIGRRGGSRSREAATVFTRASAGRRDLAPVRQMMSGEAHGLVLSNLPWAL